MRTSLLRLYPVGMQAFGADIPGHIYLGMGVLIGLPILGFIAFEMWKTLTENRRIRRARRKLEEIQEVMRRARLYCTNNSSRAGRISSPTSRLLYFSSASFA